MVLTILAALFTIAAIVALLNRRKAVKLARSEDEYVRPSTPVWLAPVLLVVAVVLAGFATIYRVDTGEAVVIRSITGSVKDAETETGVHFKVPTDKIVRYDIRNQTVNFVGQGTGTGENGPAIGAQTSDNATAQIDVTVRYSIDANKVEDIYRGYKSQQDLVDRLVVPTVRSAVRDVPPTFAASDLRQQRPAVTALIQKTLSDQLNLKGVVIDGVDLRNIAFDAGVEESLNKIQNSRAEIESARADLEKSKIRADQERTDAQGKSDADQIIRCGAKTEPVEEIVNGKTVKTIKVIPVPISDCQNRLNEQVLTSKYIDMLNNAADKGNTMYVVPSTSNNLLQLQPKTK